MIYLAIPPCEVFGTCCISNAFKRLVLFLPVQVCVLNSRLVPSLPSSCQTNWKYHKHAMLPNCRHSDKVKHPRLINLYVVPALLYNNFKLAAASPDLLLLYSKTAAYHKVNKEPHLCLLLYHLQCIIPNHAAWNTWCHWDKPVFAMSSL